MRTIDFKAISYPGKDKRNEDYVLCHKLSHNSIVAILADGMGGLSFGAEAAKIVSESIMTTVLDKNQHHLPVDVLRMAFNAADSAIYRKCNRAVTVASPTTAAGFSRTTCTVSGRSGVPSYRGTLFSI